MKTARTLLQRSARLVAIVPFAALLCGPSPALAISLGAALASFAVLGAEDGVTNVPTSTIGGNLGATDAAVGGGYIFTSGSLHANTPEAAQAQLDLDQAISDVNALGSPTLVTGGDLDAFQALPANGGVISPGTYDVPFATTNLVGDLILDGGGSNTAVWAFRFTSSLIAGPSSNVTVVDVGDGAGVGVYWTVASAATLNGPTFAGNVFAHDLISSDGDLTIACGRLASAETQVTLIQDKISIGCERTGFELSGGFAEGVDIGSGGDINPVPEPATLLLFGFGLAGLFTFRKRLFPVA